MNVHERPRIVHGASAEEGKWLSGKPATAAQQPFMFHYRLYGLVSARLVRHAQEDLANN
jgi:hypothetical protein